MTTKEALCGLLALLILGIAGEMDYQEAVAEKAMFASVDVGSE